MCIRDSVSPEQFCGLVKIQQESVKSAATIALRRNLLTIKQVATVLDLQETAPGKSFIQLALENDYLDRADANQMIHQQQLSCPSIRSLVVECGLLTERQSAVLFQHFERSQRKPKTPIKKTPLATPTQTPAAAPVAKKQPKRVSPRQPKFKQRPVVVHQYQK